MKLHQALLILIALLLGFIAGRGTAPSRTGKDEGEPANAQKGKLHGGPIPESGEPGSKPSTRSHTRDDRKPSADQGRKISIPLSLIAKDLKEHQFQYRNFEQIGYAMDTALTMLGADEGERAQVKRVMQEAKERIYGAEKASSKVLKSDETGIDIDVSAMKDALPEIIKATQGGLRDSLAPDIGEALVGSIDWEHFYSQTGRYDAPVSFAIVRHRNGALSARTKYGDGAMSRGLRPEDFPTDGSAGPVADLFDGRWKHFVEGAKMAPVESEE